MTNQQAEKLLNDLSTMLDVKGIVGFKIARNMRMIRDELKEYFQFKEEVFRKYGTEKDDQLVVEKNNPNIVEFLAELEKLNQQEVHFDFRKITEEELIESGLSAKQMSLIWDYMVEV